MAYQPVQVHLPAPAQLQDPMELRKLRQTQLLNRAWNESLVTEADPNDPNARIGNVDQRKFYENAKALGLDPDNAAASLAWRLKQYETVGKMQDLSDKAAMTRPGFVMEKAMGRSGAGFGQPAVIDKGYKDTASTVGAGLSGAAGTTAPQGVSGAADIVGQSMSGIAGSASAEQSKPQAPVLPQGVAVPPSEQSQAPRTGWDGIDDFLGIGRKPEQMLAAQGYPAPQPQTDVPRPAGVPDMSMLVAPMPDIPEADMQMYRDQVVVPPDRRTFDEAAGDIYSATPMAGSIEASQASESGVPGIDPAWMQWDPQDDGSNVYRQNKAALDNHLKMQGLLDANTLLRRVTESAYKQAMGNAVPPNPALYGIDRKEFLKMQSEFVAKQRGAVGTAMKANQDLRSQFGDVVRKYGDATVDQRKTEMPGGYLRDESKRDQASALATNKQTLEHVRGYLLDAVDMSNPSNPKVNAAKLMFAVPQLAAAMATTRNPGQQPSVVSLNEQIMSLIPELKNVQDVQDKMAMAGTRWLLSGLKDASGFTSIFQELDAINPLQLANRFAKAWENANSDNNLRYTHYVGSDEPESKQSLDKWFEGAQAESRAKKQPAADTAAAPAPKAPTKPNTTPPKKPVPKPKTQAPGALTPEQKEAKIAALKARGLL